MHTRKEISHMRNRKLRVFALILTFILIGTTVTGQLQYGAAAATKQNISINLTNIVMRRGQSRQLKITGTTRAVKWKTSNKSVAAVNSKGKITARKSGTATITATVNKKKYSCRVTVSAAKKKNETKALIVYFSYSGTTAGVANRLRKITGADVLRIREKNRYSDDYEKTATRAQREMQKKSRPAITSAVLNMKDYDVIYVGYPIWWHSTPKVIDTFLSKYNLKGKTVIPFCTSGGSDISESMDIINSLCKGSTILDGYTAESGSTSEIRSWLKSIGMSK